MFERTRAPPGRRRLCTPRAGKAPWRPRAACGALKRPLSSRSQNIVRTRAVGGRRMSWRSPARSVLWLTCEGEKANEVRRLHYAVFWNLSVIRVLSLTCSAVPWRRRGRANRGARRIECSTRRSRTHPLIAHRMWANTVRSATVARGAVGSLKRRNVLPSASALGV